MPNVYVQGGRLSSIDRIKAINSITEVRDVQIKSDRCPRINDESIVESWNIWKAASLTLATVSAVVSYQNAKKRYDIAKRYWKLAKSEFDHFFDNYVPLEKEELAELKAMPIPVTDYDTSRKGHTANINSIYDNIYSHRASVSDKYCLCPDPTAEVQFLIAKSTMEGDLDNFSRRYAEDLRQRRDDLRWEKRINATNRGRNLTSKAKQFADLAQSFYGDYSDAMTSVAQGLSGIAGYMGKRRETRYNERYPDRVDSRVDFGDDGRSFGRRAVYESSIPNTYDPGRVYSGGGYNYEFFDDLNSNNQEYSFSSPMGIDNSATGFDPTMGFATSNNGLFNA